MCLYMCILINSWLTLDETLSVQGLSESPDFEFEYADTDKWGAELSGVCSLYVSVKCN